MVWQKCFTLNLTFHALGLGYSLMTSLVAEEGVAGQDKEVSVSSIMFREERVNKVDVVHVGATYSNVSCVVCLTKSVGSMGTE